jgi:hypothetical protein
MFSLIPRYEDTKGCISRYCHTSCSVSVTRIHLEAPHASTYIILLYIETQTKASMQRSIICAHDKRISFIYLHLVLSTPHDMGTQDIR